MDAEKVDIVKAFSSHFRDYKFYTTGNGIYEIKTNWEKNNISEIPTLTLADKRPGISEIEVITARFDQVTD